MRNHIALELLRLSLMCLLMAFACGTPAAALAADRPNIIFILADDLGIGDLGCYGQQLIQTPHIDRLAADGLRFTNCYAGAAVCAPSRCVLMTGKHVGHARVRGNAARVGGVGPERRVPLEPGDVTVAEVLKSAGYKTGLIGKWGLGEPETNGVPTRQGFDEFFGYLNQNHAAEYYTDYLWRNETRFEIAANGNGQRRQYTHDLFADAALDFVQRHKALPFFLYLAWTIPHAEYVVPSLEPYGLLPWPEEAKVHAAMISRMDRDVGRLMALLKDLGLDEKTIVFFSSDNGAVRRWDRQFDSAGPWRGKKGDLYEGGIRTPMLVRWPGRVAAGRTDNISWTFADVLPTLAALAGANSPSEIDGNSVLPTILGEQPQDLSERFLYWEHHARQFTQAVRWRDWKAVRPAPGQPLELYNLVTSPDESLNCAAEFPAVLQKMETYLTAARTETPHWPVPKQQP